MSRRPINKPDLSSGMGGWVDPAFINQAARTELMLNLQTAPLNGEQKENLLNFANDMGQMLHAQETATSNSQLEQIEAVANNAHRLLASINLLSQPARQTLNAYADYLAWGSSPEVLLDQHIRTAIKDSANGVLSQSWDWVAALETASQYAAGKFTFTRQSKPEQSRARGYVAMLAQQIHAMTGNPPPKDRSAWFAGFMQCLGAHVGLSIGPRIVASGIKLQNSHVDTLK